jgi:hypothetical protein
MDQYFFAGGIEKYLEYDFGYPFVFINGNAFFFALNLHLNFTDRDSTFNYVVLAKSKLLNLDILSLSTGGSYEADLNSLFVPHEFLYEKPILYGLGLDSLGNPIAISVIDSIYSVYDFPCNTNSDPLELKSVEYTLNKPFNFKLAGEGQFKCITIWQEKIGIVGLVGGMHKVLFSPNGISVLETYETPHSVVRKRDSPFKVTHTLVNTP